MSFLADVLAHTALFMAFLPVFFFFYVGQVQTDSLVKDAFNILSPLVGDVSKIVNPLFGYNVTDDLIEGGSTLLSYELTDETKSIQQGNQQVLMYLGIVVGILAPTMFIAACILEYNHGGNVPLFIISNLIVLTFIAAAEFAIVGIFLGQFTEIDSTVVKQIISAELVSPSYSECLYMKQFMKKSLGISV
jgi:hypothetical protein